MSSQTRSIPHGSDQARNILKEIQVRVMSSHRRLQTKHQQWQEAEESALAYLPEREVDAKRKEARENGLPQYTTIQIPYSYAVLMAAHTYFTSVFMGRNPIFQYTGRHGESEQQTQALEALIDYQMLVGQMMPPLYTWLYDAGKYGAGIVGCYWEDRMESVSQIVSEDELDFMGMPTGKKVKKQQTALFKTYSGNKLYNVQPWDFYWDTRVPLRSFQQGEYCAVHRVLGWNEIKRRARQGFYYNLESLPSGNTKNQFTTAFSASQLERPETFDWMGSPEQDSSNKGKKHPSTSGLFECYVELIPNEWGLGPIDFPEKWVFTCSDDFGTLIGCQPLGALHAKFPFQCLALEPEAYGLTTRGMPETLKPIQDTIDWLVNSHFFNVRATLNNKLIVDPSRVVMKDVLDPLPGGIVRLKPEAYGTDPKQVITQLQMSDVTRTHLSDLQTMFGIGERAIGVNDQIMGMVAAGGRKTATEVRTSTSFGVNRLKTISEYFSVVGFDPLSQMFVQNTQQFYDQEQKFKIAGDLVQEAGMRFMQVTPDLITGFYNFVPVDGTLPIDRYAQANLWQGLLGQLRNFPEISLQYDMARIFEWVAKLAGLKNISQFKAQILPDQQLLLQAKLGNVVPLNGKNAGGGSAPAKPKGNLNEPGQLPGMGPTG